MKNAEQFIREVEKIVGQFNDGLASDEEVENKTVIFAVVRLEAHATM